MYFSSGDPERDRLQGEAADVVQRWENVETVGKALADPDHKMQWWALASFREDPETQETWSPLIPKVERLAVKGDANIRVLAVGKLRWYPQCRDFLARRTAEDTSPVVLMRLMRGSTGGAEYQRRLCERVLLLLRHDDENVRSGALSFVGSNSTRAKMWQFPFGKDTFDLVVELTRSQSAAERSKAVYALLDIRKLDPGRSRETLLSLVDDESDDVRWRLSLRLGTPFG